MAVATHVVKVRGTFDRNIWDGNKLRKYVRKKIICDMDSSFHTHLELFNVNGGGDKSKIEVWVHIHAYPSEVTKGTIEIWMGDHIREYGLTVEEFEFEMMVDITEYGWKDIPFTNMPWPSFDDMDDEERKLFREKSVDEWKKNIESYSSYSSEKEEKRKEEGINHIYIKKK